MKKKKKESNVLENAEKKERKDNHSHKNKINIVVGLVGKTFFDF